MAGQYHRNFVIRRSGRRCPYSLDVLPLSRHDTIRRRVPDAPHFDRHQEILSCFACCLVPSTCATTASPERAVPPRRYSTRSTNADSLRLRFFPVDGRRGRDAMTQRVDFARAHERVACRLEHLIRLTALKASDSLPSPPVARRLCSPASPEGRRLAPLRCLFTPHAHDAAQSFAITGFKRRVSNSEPPPIAQILSVASLVAHGRPSLHGCCLSASSAPLLLTLPRYSGKERERGECCAPTMGDGFQRSSN